MHAHCLLRAVQSLERNLYIVMEYCAKGSLWSALLHNTFHKVRHVGRGAALTLTHIHGSFGCW